MLTWLLAPPLCWGCAAAVRPDEHLCLPCRRGLRRLGREPVSLAGVPAWAPVAYEGAARELVRALKFRGALAAADTMGAVIAASAPDEVLPRAGPADLVPVPLHPARRRRRGFNQAAVLAEALAGRTGLRVADCLTRAGPSGTQVGRARAARLASPPGRITARAPPPARAIVVDDVATTGATLAACARALRDAGAAEVRAVTFARTLGR